MKRIYAKVCQVELSVAMFTLVACTFLIFLAAIMRYFARPINWSMDIAMFLFSWCVFLSADVGLREERLVNLDLVVSRLPRKVQLCLSLLSYALIFVFLLSLLYFGSMLTYTTRQRSFQGIPDFSYSWVTLSVPVAAVLMLITTGIKIRGVFRRLRGAAE